MPEDSSPDYTITLTNVTDKEIFCYSLPIIKGYVSAHTTGFLTVSDKIISLKKLCDGRGETENTEVTFWPVAKGNFKCLASLNHGTNKFVLQYENCRLALTLEFKSKKISYHVLPMYIICDGDDGRFQAPESEDNTPESACKRIAIGSKLIQSFTAEKLYENNLGKETFQLASDINKNLECVVFRSRLTRQDVYGMEPEEIWKYFARELVSSPYGSDKRKFLAFLSCTRYVPNGRKLETHEDVLSQMRGHVALGGGGLALFGTGCLHTWPETVDQILQRFQDETKVDTSRLMDDSCYRGNYGSCFSTTLGSVCHELGHTFDLGHSKTGIMGRGFDNINLVFTTGNQTLDANRNLTSRSEPQHSTVCFTRNLNVTYLASSPVRRVKRRPSGPLLEKEKFNSKKNEEFNAGYPKSEAHDNRNQKQMVSSSNIVTDDLTFWDKSCSVLLKYHRWFAKSEIPDEAASSIKFDRCRNVLYSPFGIRVVELRNDDGFILASWQFLHTYLPKQFILPLKNVNIRSAKMMVAEDSLGNIIKEPIT